MPSGNKPTIQQNNQVERKTHAVQASFYKGVIPSPEMMEHFGRINESFPDRILKMAEDEGEHRREMEKSMLNKSFFLDIFSNICGLAAIAAIIWLCYQFIQKDDPTAAATVASTVIVSLAVIFVLRKMPNVKNGSAGKEVK